MPAYVPLDRNIGFHPRTSEAEMRKREAMLRVAEHHFAAVELSELLADMAAGKVDVRLF